jgi:GxxExxY protein
MSNLDNELMYSDITGKIIAAAFEVHNIIGCGFHESVYHKALEIELRIRGIKSVSEKEFILHYKNEKVGLRRVDFLLKRKSLLK